MRDQDDREDPEVHDLGDGEAGADGSELEVGRVDADAQMEAVDLDDVGGRVSDIAERERLLAATVAHSVAQDYQYTLGPAGPVPVATWWKWGLSAALLLTALLVTTVPPPWLTGPVRPVPTRADRELGLEVTLTLQSAQVAAYRVRERTLPRSLEELGGSADGIRYIRSTSRSYQLVGTRPDGSVVLWDSANPPPEREALAERWLVRPVFP